MGHMLRFAHAADIHLEAASTIFCTLGRSIPPTFFAGLLPAQAVEREGLFDVVFHPVPQLRASALPLVQPYRQVAPSFLQTPPIVGSAQLRAAVTVSFARKMVNGIPQEMHAAALPRGFRQEIKDRLSQPRVVVADNELAPHPPDPAV